MVEEFGRSARRWLVVLAAAGGLWAPPAGAAPPIEHFTRVPELDGVVVSPSGKRAALLVFSRDGRRRIGVIDLDPVGAPRIVAGFGDADVQAVYWVDDDRLVFNAYQPGAEVSEGGAGTFAVDHDGSNQRQLIAWRWSTERPGSFVTTKVLPYGWYLHSASSDGSGDAFVRQRVDDVRGDIDRVQLARVNTRTGDVRNLSQGIPDGTRHWWLDVKGEPRALLAHRGGRLQVYRRAEPGVEWERIADYDELKEPGFEPWHAEVDGRLWVLHRRGGTQAVYEYDPATRQAKTEPAIAVNGFDIEPGKVVDSRSGRLLGVHFVADRPMSYWLDESLQRLQRTLDASLPGRSNRIYCGRCESARHFIVRSSSDRQPGEYFLFDREKRTLMQIGTSRPWISEASQGHRSLHRVAARDGLKLPVYVTRPAGAAEDRKLPAVMLVHGGPWLRGSDLAWDAEAQFLASRGYLVLEPEFRGSEGYGFALFRAGWKEWGRAMQTDLEDVLRWAVTAQQADPARACIVGASYGGYAALMAPIATPGVFRCAASFAGVTDIALMYDASWSDISEAARMYSMPVLIGSRESEAARLDAVSPVKRAAEIKVPVLLGYGSLDRRVPIVHARRFLSAARDAGVAVEDVFYDDEGHGFYKPANRADWYGRLERFLEQSLKAPTPASFSSR